MKFRALERIGCLEKKCILLATITVLLTHLHAELIPFSLPWNDNSQNITNFSNSLHKPSGMYGRVSISEDGHFALNDQRIRFFGANIGAAACFPPKEMADEVATRYARFGFNVVRFHHMDNSWTTSLIDYDLGSSKELNTETLDRLDYFIAALKKQGVYMNLNLLNSRRFFPEDGLGPTINDMEWKTQAIVAMFHEGARNLQKEYAAKLLQHVNPYTEMSYAEDPAIAFVEVNNENGLFHQWHGGSLNDLPAPFNHALSLRWNQWLQNKYASNQDMLNAWQPIDQPLGSNMVLNGNFASTDTWHLEQHSGAAATFEIVNEFNGQSAAKIETTTSGTQGWHVQFNQPNLILEAGKLYTISYWLKGNRSNNVGISVMQAHDPYSQLGYNHSVSLNAQWTQYEGTFTATQTDNNARLNFTGLASSLGTLYIADVQLREGGKIGTLPEGVRLEDGNVPTPKTSAPFTQQAMLDWYRFMRDVEIEYWSDMKFFIEQLGYAGVQWGTTIMNSPPSAQAVFGVTDSHAYWNHPHFWGSDWSATDWTVDNAPMVNDDEGGVIPALSWQRIKGMPHNVTEYQHSAPNTYSSDAGLFAGIYGSIQDWDGIYLFHYGSGEDDWDRGYFNGFFDVDHHPAKLVNAAIASLAFRRFDIPSADTEITIPFGSETELEVLASKGAAWNVGDARHLEMGEHLPLMYRVSMDLDLELASTDFLIPEAPLEPIYTTDNQMVSWDQSIPGSGVVTVKTSKLKSAIGFDAERVFDLNGIVINAGASEQGWTAISAVVTEGVGFDQLSAGCKGIVVATGNTENTAMGWTDATKTSVAGNWGQAPTLVENVPAYITFGAPASAVNVWSLDTKGNRIASITVYPAGANSYFQLGGQTGSLWYEFEVRAH